MQKHENNIQWKFFNILILLILCLFLAACGTKTTTSKKGIHKGYAISKTAQSQIGKKYTFGGATPSKGFDCSGLIQWAYKKHGIKVPRVTKDQAKTGKKVPSSRAKPGDIVVFRSKYTSSGYHTGIYIGNDKFVHSPKSGAKVRIESLNSYWKPKVASVRRIVR